MKPVLLIAGALILTSSCLWLPDAYAQFGGGGGGPGGGGMPSGGRHGGERSKGCDFEGAKVGEKPAGPGTEPLSAEQLSFQLNALQIDLHLSPEQAGVWGQFAEQVKTLQSDQARERDRGRTVSANVLAPAAFNGMQSIRMSVDRARNRMTALEDLEMSAKAAYAVLQPDQKAHADLRLGAFLQALIRV